jgi:hypothetical protein
VIVPYASRTGTRSTLASLRAHGWRLLVSATGCHRTEGFRYALDNGAWTAFQQGAPFDFRSFERLLIALGSKADWCVVPDIVQGGAESLAFSMSWLPRVLDACPVALLAVQDGMTEDDVASLLGPRVGLFVGGSTSWKLATLAAWSRLAKDAGTICHVGRVNTARRVSACVAAGVTSFDGTSVTRFPKTIYRLDHARRQGDMFQ